MNTGKQVRKFLIHAGILAAITLTILLMTNFVSNISEVNEKQEKLSEDFSGVINGSSFEEFELSDTANELYSEIESVYTVYDENGDLAGYAAKVTVAYSNETLTCNVAISDDVTKLLNVDIDEDVIPDSEEEEFFMQFESVRVPIALSIDVENASETDTVYDPIPGLNDGTYYEIVDEEDDDGYKDYVEMTIEDGRITNVVWDAIEVDGGDNRAAASVSGDYTTSSGDVWAVQAFAMGNELIEVQDPARIAVKSDGTTEVVSGVVIDVNLFLTLANRCIEDAKDSESDTDTSSDSETSSSSTETTYEDETDDEVEENEEDGVVLDDTDESDSNLIDGFDYSEIKIQVDYAAGKEEESRAIVSAVNITYSFLTSYFKGEL